MERYAERVKMGRGPGRSAVESGYRALCAPPERSGKTADEAGWSRVLDALKFCRVEYDIPEHGEMTRRLPISLPRAPRGRRTARLRDTGKAARARLNDARGDDLAGIARGAALRSARRCARKARLPEDSRDVPGR